MNPDKPKEPEVVPQWKTLLLEAIAQLPEHVQIPYDRTPEGERWARYKEVCPEEFHPRIDRARLPDPKAFDTVANWNGDFPGPCAYGDTDTAKTRAAWWALRQLYVLKNKTFAWFPVKKLITEMQGFESKGMSSEFFRGYSHYRIWLVDDIDKINWRDEDQISMLFDFYDRVYRQHIPVITTTNKDADWWEERMGEAMRRRLFKDAHYAVQFKSRGKTS